VLISREWLADFVNLSAEISDAQLAHDLTLHTVEVEGFTDVSTRLDGAIVARLLSTKPVGNQSEAVLDIGDSEIRIPFDRVPVEVDLVAVIKGEHGWNIVDPTTLGIDLLFPKGSIIGFRDHEVNTKLGEELSSVIGWNDTVFEIDNKSLTNRPDLWGHMGIARELAAIYGLEFHEPKRDEDFVLPQSTPGMIGTIDAAKCSRLSLIRLTNDAQNTHSPLIVRSRLAKVGQRSINLFTDLTNYVMHAIGQPCHAYDATLLDLPLSVSISSGDSLSVLGGKSVDLGNQTTVVKDRKGPVSIAGIIGGAASAVKDSSRDVIIEIGTFDASSIRSSSLALGLRTDASARFEKGLDTQLANPATTLLLSTLRNFDDSISIADYSDVAVRTTDRTKIHTSVDFLNSRMGTALSGNEISEILKPLGFQVNQDGSDLLVEAPTWRSTGDISIPNDVLEEVARIIGYDNLPPASPSVILRAPTMPPLLAAQRRIREFLAHDVGAQEILTYPWVEDRLLSACDMDSSPMIRIEGGSSKDRTSLRPSLIPNLMGAVESNLSNYSEFALFEVGTTYHKTVSGQPGLTCNVAAVFVGSSQDETFRRAVGAINGFAISARVHKFDLTGDANSTAWGDSIACRTIIADEKVIGRVASIDLSSFRHTARGAFCTAFEVDLDQLTFANSRSNKYQRISTFPSSSIDISLRVPNDVHWSQIANAMKPDIENVRFIEFIDEYRSPEFGVGWKSISFSARLQSFERTLEAADKEAARAEIVQRLAASIGAEERT
jgi:phenylalanyl-tRNA synthetase beta chain